MLLEDSDNPHKGSGTESLGSVNHRFYEQVVNGRETCSLFRLCLIIPASVPQNNRKPAFSPLLSHCFIWSSGPDSPKAWASLFHLVAVPRPARGPESLGSLLKIPMPGPHLLKPSLWGRGSGICIFNKLLRDSTSQPSWRVPRCSRPRSDPRQADFSRYSHADTVQTCLCLPVVD